MNKHITSTLWALMLCGLLALGCTARQEAQKPSFVWIEAGANFGSYANDADSIARDCARRA